MKNERKRWIPTKRKCSSPQSPLFMTCSLTWWSTTFLCVLALRTTVRLTPLSMIMINEFYNVPKKYVHVSFLVSNRTESVVMYRFNEKILHDVKKSYHSEEKTIIDFIRRQNRRRIVNPSEIRCGFYLISLAISRGGSLRISKPCYHCSRLLSSCSELVLKVYYMTSEKELVCRKPENLLSDSKVSLGYRR